METKNKRLFLLAEEKTGKALLKLGVPTMVGMMVSALYNLVDVYFVGKLGTAQMGAVAVVYPIGVIILGIGLLFGAGAASYLSRLLGNEEYEKAGNCASTALFSSLFVGGGLILLMLLFLTPLLRVLGATDTILPYAREYAILFLLGLLFNVFNITVNNMITAEGATNISMGAMLCGGIANLILDPVLISYFGMGVRGAAIATLVARCISAAIYLSYLLSGKSSFKFSAKDFAPAKALYLEIMKIGVPTLTFQLLVSVSLGIINVLASSYGDAAIAALGVASRLFSFGNMAVFGFMKGYQPFVGYNYGAGKVERMKEATKKVLLWSTVFCVSVAVAVVAFATPIMAAFSKQDAQVIAIGRVALIWNALTFTVMGYQAVYSAYFMALGKAKEGGMIAVGRQGLFFIPVVYIAAAVGHLNGIMMSQALADVCSVILVTILVYKEKRIVSKPQSAMREAKAV